LSYQSVKVNPVLNGRPISKQGLTFGLIFMHKLNRIREPDNESLLFKKISKALTKPEEPNDCWDAGKMMLFFLDLHLLCFSRAFSGLTYKHNIADKTPGQ